MTAPRSRRSLLRVGAASTAAFLPLAGCSAFADDGPEPVPVFVDNRDDTAHEVRLWVDGTEELFRTEFSVGAGALVHVTDVEASGFCLHARVAGLDGTEAVTCPARGESDYFPNGYVVVVYSDPDDDGSEYTIRPVRDAESSGEPSE